MMMSSRRPMEKGSSDLFTGWLWQGSMSVAIAEVISLASSIEVADKLLKGEVTGRVVVDVNK